MRDLYPLTRRRLLTAMALSPLLWQMNMAQAAAIDPRRIVALEWLPVELLLALGITPYGVADVPNYKLWVSEPPLPDSVIDVGLRTEPNLELLTEMKPSFMVWSAGYGPSPEKLARIAPGRGFDFSDGKKPLAVARRSLVELAQTLNLEAAAENIWRNTIASSPARSRILSAAGASVTDDDAYRSAAYAGARPELPVPGGAGRVWHCQCLAG